MPDRSSQKSAGIEIACRPDRLRVDDGREPVRSGLRHRHPGAHRGHGAVRECFGQHAADQLTLVAGIELQQLRDGAADIGVAGRRRIDEMRFEIRALHGHEIPGVGAAERAAHALALL